MSACRLAGVDPGPRTLAYIRREGGIPKSRLFTKCFMALLGQWPWQRMAPIPPELALVPPGSPFSIYDFSCWARQTFVALSVAQSLRPVRHADVDLTAIGARPGKTRPPGRPNRLRRRAVTVAERWIRERQEADGSWGGIQPPVGVGDHRARRARERARRSDARQGCRGLAGLHGRRRRAAAAGGLPVAGMGHGARGARPAGVRPAGRPRGAPQSRRLPPAGGGDRQG